jgi:CubicO group peptidase (beta-lactamase class C family)
VERRAAFAAWVLRGKPAGPIGQGLYSNGGYTIAAAIAERVTGRSWASLVRARVFEPLGIAGASPGPTLRT